MVEERFFLTLLVLDKALGELLPFSLGNAAGSDTVVEAAIRGDRP